MNPKHDIFTKRGLDPHGAVVRAQGFLRYAGDTWRERQAVVATVEPLYAEAEGPPRVHDWSPPSYTDPEYAEVHVKDPVKSWLGWRVWAFGVDGWLMPRHAVMPDDLGWGDAPVAQLRPDVPLPGRPARHWARHRGLGAMARREHERSVCEAFDPTKAYHPRALRAVVPHPDGDFLPTGHLHPATGQEVVPIGADHRHHREAKYLYTPGGTARRLGTNPLVLERGWGTPDDLFVFVMEGTLKMCAVAEAGYPVIDAGSVTLWNGTRAVWDDAPWDPDFSYLGDRLEREIDAFARLHLGGRTVAVICDSDWNENDNVREETDHVVRILEGHGARAVRCAPPSRPADHPEGPKRGIDDWLGEGHDLLDIRVPGPADLTPDHPMLAHIRRADGRESATDLALDMGRRADERGIVAYRPKDQVARTGMATTTQDRALENLMVGGVTSQMHEAEHRGPDQGTTASLWYVDEVARPRPVTLRSWLSS